MSRENPIESLRLVRLGTRGSALALWQTRRIADWLMGSGGVERAESAIIGTRGDADRVSPLAELGRKGVFTEEIEEALRSGAIDAAVHSLKDLPLDAGPDVVVAAVCFREDPRDVLVTRDARPLAGLETGARVGTSSPRRVAMLAQLRPDLRAVPIRGNVETRIAKVDRGEYDAVILAAAGVVRLGLASRVSDYLDAAEFPPSPGQGALAVQCRANDGDLAAVLRELDDPVVRACTDAERAFLRGLGGGCSLPVGAWATPVSSGRGRRARLPDAPSEPGPSTPGSDELRLVGFVGSPAGRGAIRVMGVAARESATQLGERLACEAADAGALELMT